MYFLDADSMLKMRTNNLSDNDKYIMEDGSTAKRFNKCDWENGIPIAKGQWLAKNDGTFSYIVPNKSEENYTDINIAIK